MHTPPEVGARAAALSITCTRRRVLSRWLMMGNSCRKKAILLCTSRRLVARDPPAQSPRT